MTGHLHQLSQAVFQDNKSCQRGAKNARNINRRYVKFTEVMVRYLIAR